MIDQQKDNKEIKVENNIKNINTEESQTKKSILNSLLYQNIRSRSELSKNSYSQNLYKQQKQNQKDLKQKIDIFQQSLLTVNNKQIYQKIKCNTEATEDMGNQQNNYQNGIGQVSTKLPKRKVLKKFNGMAYDKITENLNTPNTKNNYQSVYTSDFMDKYSNDTDRTNEQSQNTLNSQRKVETLPNIRQKSMSNLLSTENKLANKNSNIFSLSHRSLSHYKGDKNKMVDQRKNNDIFSSSFDQQQFIRQEYNLDQATQRGNKMKTEVDDSTLNALNDQKDKILSGIEELKQLRQRKNAQRKLKKLNKIKQKIDQLQELEKQIPEIEKINGEIDQQKRKELEEKLEIYNDGKSSIISSDQEDILSRNSDDFIFQKLDQISISDAGDYQQKIDQQDEVISQSSQLSTQNKLNLDQNTLQQLPTISTKSPKNMLESIMEEHQDYFQHIAGTCACGECHCGKCQVKCKLNQKKPIFFEMRWQSSYNRFYNGNKFMQNSNQLNSLNDLRIDRQAHITPKPNPQDYNSTFKNDYKYPQDIQYKKVVKYDRIPESPLYSLSTYQVKQKQIAKLKKTNFVDWKANVPEHNKHGHIKTVVEGVPLTGISQMKKDYQIFQSPNTQMIRPTNHSPLPKFSINKYNSINKKLDFKHAEQDFIRSDSFQRKSQEYQPVPSFEGQYKTTASKHYKIDTINCEGTKKLYDMYQRKIEKYQKQLKEEIEKIEQVK